MATRVVNKHYEDFDVFIGRPSIYGNPFKIGADGTREDVLDKYRTWFQHRLSDQRFVLSLERLRGKRLGCYCKPLACHGDVIVEYLNKRESAAVDESGSDSTNSGSTRSVRSDVQSA